MKLKNGSSTIKDRSTNASSAPKQMHQFKEKVPDVSDSHQNIETSCNSKLKLPNLKICVSKLQKAT